MNKQAFLEGYLEKTANRWLYRVLDLMSEADPAKRAEIVKRVSALGGRTGEIPADAVQNAAGLKSLVKDLQPEALERLIDTLQKKGLLTFDTKLGDLPFDPSTTLWKGGIKPAHHSYKDGVWEPETSATWYTSQAPIAKDYLTARAGKDKASGKILGEYSRKDIGPSVYTRSLGKDVRRKASSLKEVEDLPAELPHVTEPESDSWSFNASALAKDPLYETVGEWAAPTNLYALKEGKGIFGLLKKDMVAKLPRSASKFYTHAARTPIETTPKISIKDYRRAVDRLAEQPEEQAALVRDLFSLHRSVPGLGK